MSYDMMTVLPGLVTSGLVTEMEKRGNVCSVSFQRKIYLLNINATKGRPNHSPNFFGPVFGGAGKQFSTVILSCLSIYSPPFIIRPVVVSRFTTFKSMFVCIMVIRF